MKPIKLDQLYTLYRQSTGVCTDTRQVFEGCIFFALKGENFNGNRFADQALKSGASYAVIDEQEFIAGPDILWVEDVLEALQNLGNHHRKTLSIPVVGLTGSNGKTTVKELVHSVLRSKYKVTATRGNLNNHIGVPLTLLAIDVDTEIAIIEMGANHQGEIAFLSRLAEPTHGVITNIGKAHLEGFGGEEGIKKGKKELYDYLEETGGVAFVNAADPVLMELSKAISHRIFFQGDSNDQVKAEIVNQAPTLEFKWREGEYFSEKLSTQLVGDYNLGNILVAICIGRYFEVAAVQINSAIEAYTPSNNRSQLRRSAKNLLILDHYNANPTSTGAAIRHFAQQTQAPRLAIIGDMLELGDEASKEHRTILDMLNRENIPAILVGPEFCKVLNDSGAPRKQGFETVDEAAGYLKANPVENHTILIKGSRGISLEQLDPLL